MVALSDELRAAAGEVALDSGGRGLTSLCCLPGVPEFARGSSLLEDAFELAVDSHSGSGRRKNTDIDHPIAVAELLEAHGFAPEVVAAGLLHDVVEDTDTAIDEITDRFGPRVGELVAAMTEDDSIEPYEARKSEHRGRVASNVDASAIYAADKLAKTRALMDGAEPASDAQLEHYKRTLEMLSETQPDLAFLAELEGNLRAIDADRQHAARR